MNAPLTVGERSRRWRYGALFIALLSGAPAHALTTLIAAGDVALCAQNAENSMAAQTAKLVPADAQVLVLGDTVYPIISDHTFDTCYLPTWGRFLERTYAVPGNHDIVDHTADIFLRHFNRPAGRLTYFKAPLGEDAWLFGLDSNLKSSALEQQTAWLAKELAALPADHRCLIAMWHHATISTGLHRGDGDGLKPAWRLLNQAKADVVLSGHEHFYESFDPRGDDALPAAEGIREFIVGTGGAQMIDVGLGQGQRRLYRKFGVLKLVLQHHHVDYQFLTIDGQHLDAGQFNCRR